jgi:hypothetical protein
MDLEDVTFPLKMPCSMYDLARELAQREHISVRAYLLDALMEKIKSDSRRRQQA